MYVIYWCFNVTNVTGSICKEQCFNFLQYLKTTTVKYTDVNLEKDLTWNLKEFEIYFTIPYVVDEHIITSDAK